MILNAVTWYLEFNLHALQGLGDVLVFLARAQLWAHHELEQAAFRLGLSTIWPPAVTCVGISAGASFSTYKAVVVYRRWPKPGFVRRLEDSLGLLALLSVFLFLPIITAVGIVIVLLRGGESSPSKASGSDAGVKHYPTPPAQQPEGFFTAVGKDYWLTEEQRARKYSSEMWKARGVSDMLRVAAKRGWFNQ